MMFLRGSCALALAGGATASMSPGNFAAEVEERLWKWVRDSGGFVSEAVSAAPRGEMRSIRAVKDISEGEDLIVIPPALQLYPEREAKRDRFFKLMKKQELPLHASDFALYILRQIRLRAGRRAADPSAEAQGYDYMWDWLEFHLKAVGDYLEAWDDADVEMLGKSQLATTRGSQERFERSRAQAVAIVKKRCGATGSEQAVAACADVEGLGRVTPEDFFAAAHMSRSRSFSDGMIVPVASLLNHAPPIFSTAEFQYGDYGVNDFRVWAKRDITAGEEITITYGNWHNHMLLMEHAFTLPPRLEPNFYFAAQVRDLKNNVFGQFDLSTANFPSRIDLVTPWLYSDIDDDPWDSESQLQSVRTFVGLGGLPGLEQLVEHYAEESEGPPLVAPFVAQLAKNRAQNRTSRVWWADEEDAETSDASDAEALGSAHRSHAVRVLMSRVLCLTVYREAILVEKGELDAGDAIASAAELAMELAAMKEAVGSDPRDALMKAVEVVEKAVAKAEFADIPKADLKVARRFVSEMRDGARHKTTEL